MLQIKKILYPTDFSRCAQQALDHALYLAEQYNAELHMLHAIVLHEEDPHNPAHHFPNVEDVHKRLKELAHERMSEAVEPHAKDGLNVKLVQERGISSASVILDYAKEQGVDLVVMGTHGRRGLGHLFLGSVAEEVVRLAGCPVLTIRERKEPMPVEAIERLLVPLDFSEHARAALRHAREIAATYGARLQLLHVVEETVHPAFYVTGETSIFKLIPDIREKSEAAMKNMFNEVGGAEVEFDLHVVEGRAARDIVKFAGKNGADLIVIATHGLTGIEHLLLGSVTEKVVRQAPCPVFTVKSFGKSLVQ